LVNENADGLVIKAPSDYIAHRIEPKLEKEATLDATLPTQAVTKEKIATPVKVTKML